MSVGIDLYPALLRAHKGQDQTDKRRLASSRFTKDSSTRARTEVE